MPAGVTSTVEWSNRSTVILNWISPPVFYWINLWFNSITDKTADEYCQSMAPDYYGKAYNPLKHFDTLPHSERQVSGVNNYLIPTELADWISLGKFYTETQHCSKFVWGFVTDKYLHSMGFDSNQYEKRKYKNDSFKMENEDFANLLTIECNEKILPELIIMHNNFRISMELLKKILFHATMLCKIPQNIQSKMKDLKLNWKKHLRLWKNQQHFIRCHLLSSHQKI
jgi:hypothetical protein